MAGLLAARVLSDRFSRVTVVERDTLPAGAAHRRGVPQAHHTHGLLAGGAQVLDRLFPGLTDQLVANGAIRSDILARTRWVFEGAPLAQVPSGMDSVTCTRPFIEATVRARVRGIRNVTFRDGNHAIALRTDDAGYRVTGVALMNGDVLEADFVVDASGRGSRICQWLQTLGYVAPIEERVEVGLAYTTRMFRREAQHLDGDCGVVVPPTPSGKRGGVLIAQEGDRWTVTLIAHFVPAAGEAVDDFVAFAAQLPCSDIHDIIKSAEPLGHAATARFPASVRRRFERLTRFPEGLVVMGDAICSFNPIYGQGMSVAALEAVALGEILDAGNRQTGKRFFRRAARIIDTPWTTAVGNDLRMPEVTGPRTAIGELITRYISQLHKAAHHDAALAIGFMRVANLVAPPSALFAPATIARVLRSVVGARRRLAARDAVATGLTQSSSAS